MTTERERFDAIVIGSGIGGLTCASLLAQLRGMRVLVLERHWRLGGFTHEFRRPGRGPWPVGVHYVGQMREGDELRAVMDLVTGGRVSWSAIASPLERFHFPGFTFEQPTGRQSYIEKLARNWPAEADAISRWFALIDEGYRHFARRVVAERSEAERGPGARQRPCAGIARLTTSEALDSAGICDLELRAVLSAQWGNYGLPPGASAFIGHAVVVRHFLEGGWFPREGATMIAEGARAVIEAAGGRCLVSTPVGAVIRRAGKAVGVRAARAPEGEAPEWFAPLVISDAGALTTFGSLLPPDAPGAKGALEQIAQLRMRSSAVQLFLALDGSPARLGVAGGNHWMFTGIDHDRTYQRRNQLFDGVASTGYLSFPSLKVAGAPYHTAEIVAPLDAEVLERWRAGSWLRRGDEYERVKKVISDALVEFADSHVPGLSAMVTHAELATPLSVESLMGHAAGAIYGLPHEPPRYSMSCLRVATDVPGLLLTGSDVATSGICGAMMGGVATVGHVLGAGGIPRVMAVARRRP